MMPEPSGHGARLTVWCAEWVLGDRGRGFAVGDAFSERLMLETGDWAVECRQPLSGVVSAVPGHEGQTSGHHAYRLDAGPAVVYWESPTPVDIGPVSLLAALVVDVHQTPPDWPATQGTVRRVRKEYRWFREVEPRSWEPAPGAAQYVEVVDSGWSGMEAAPPERGPCRALDRRAARRRAPSDRPMRSVRIREAGGWASPLP